MADVIHNEAARVFTLTPDAANAESEPAVLKYVFVSERRVDFTSTFVPPALRNQGLAEKLVHTGLAWAKENGYDIDASCWYVAKFMRHG